MIRVIYKNGLSYPHFCCDKCGKAIDRDAVFTWNWVNVDPSGIVRCYCKTHECEKRGIQRCDPDNGPWQELDQIMYMLMKNHKVNMKEAKQKFECMNGEI